MKNYAKLRAFLESIADMETWEEQCRYHYNADLAANQEDGISFEEYLQAQQTDLDYLIGKQEILEELIRRARELIGKKPSETAA